MDFFGAIVSGLLTTVSYVAIFLCVYKLFQIASDIREIKDSVANSRRVVSVAPPFASVGKHAVTPESTKDSIADDSAAAYAEHLLRSVNVEQRAGSERQEVR